MNRIVISTSELAYITPKFDREIMVSAKLVDVNGEDPTIENKGNDSISFDSTKQIKASVDSFDHIYKQKFVRRFV